LRRAAQERNKRRIHPKLKGKVSNKVLPKQDEGFLSLVSGLFDAFNDIDLKPFIWNISSQNLD